MFATYFHNVRKIFALSVVVCFDKDFTQPTLSYRVVLSIELVKSVESVPVLK